MIKNKNNHGILDLDYAKRRESNIALKYRLWRRTFEVQESIKRFSKKKPNLYNRFWNC